MADRDGGHARRAEAAGFDPAIHVSGSGPQATELAGRVGDGYCSVAPDAEPVRVFREPGG